MKRKIPNRKKTEEEELFGRIHAEFMDTFDEEIEMELADSAEEAPRDTSDAARIGQDVRDFRKMYFKELHRLQLELVRLQDWVVDTKRKIVIIFEGRDAAGKGGTIKRIVQTLNPRVCRVVALPAPTEREKSQWYFQRYVNHLPAGGEVVLLDRSWYNRAGVERVMGFCTDDEYEEFFRTVPEFEKMLVRSGIQLIKYWFSITDAEQQFRFLCRLQDPLKQWKLSPMDLESRARWEQYTLAKEIMIERTSIPEAPWWIVPSVNKKKARLNCIDHLLSLVPYQDTQRPWVDLPKRIHHKEYVRKQLPPELVVPEKY